MTPQNKECEKFYRTPMCNQSWKAAIKIDVCHCKDLESAILCVHKE